MSGKLLSALIFKICSGGSEEDMLTCWDKIINCSNLQSEQAVLSCKSKTSNGESYETFIKRIRTK
jgi:hypothetical protein